jgi:hypothetical protein
MKRMGLKITSNYICHEYLIYKLNTGFVKIKEGSLIYIFLFYFSYNYHNKKI